MATRLVLRGDDAALSLALDWFYLHSRVLGVIENDAETEVYTEESLEALPEFAGVAVTRLQADMDQVWTGLEDDAPIYVAPDLVVRPPWVASPADFAGFELVVPRGMAFGSGEHDSTQAALLLLRDHWSQPAVLADIGTGSGILALAADHLGAAQILACDIEEAAVEAARELLPDADVRLGGPELFAAAAADCVVANLNGRELVHAMPDLLSLWNRRGPLIVSGMRGASEEEGVRALIPAEPVARIERGAFCGLAYAPDRGA